MNPKTERNDLATPYVDQYNCPVGGLTKREHFAAMAMAGLVSNAGLQLDTAYAAKYAAELADSLIKALNKDEENYE